MNKILLLSKAQIDDYIFCKHKFGLQVINDKYKNKAYVKDSIFNYRKCVKEIASHEMRENVKLGLQEYRIRYTNKYVSNKLKIASLLDTEVQSNKLNNFFSLFADNCFIGYNIPVDISIAGTNIMYRDVVDFGLIDDEKVLTFVDFVDMLDPIFIKDKLKYWPHYYVPYSYLAFNFNKSINVVLIDPDVNDRIEFKVVPERFEQDYEEMCNMLKSVKDTSMIRNLYSCNKCLYLNECFGKK